MTDGKLHCHLVAYQGTGGACFLLKESILIFSIATDETFYTDSLFIYFTLHHFF